VKKHLKMKKFKALDSDVLQKYASVFNVSVEELKDVEKVKNFKLEI